MKRNIKKQDKILSTIGLKRSMDWLPVSQFKRYVTSEYLNSERREMDEFYRMNEFNLLHIPSGLRLTLTSHESYDGEAVEYKVIRMFITTLNGEELEVLDANFKDEIFYTSDLEFPFSQTYFTKEELAEMEKLGEIKQESIQRVMIDLVLRRRKPKNEFEERLFKQIRDIESKGGIVDIPSE